MPAPQTVQLGLPAVSEKVPTGQSTHGPPLPDVLPGGHAVHCEASVEEAGEEKPAAHATGAGLAPPGHQKPAGHAVAPVVEPRGQ